MVLVLLLLLQLKVFSYRPVTEDPDEYGESYGYTERSDANAAAESEGGEAGENANTGDDQEYGNLLHYLGYRKEDRSCPEGWVMDIYGYCR